MSRAFTTTRRVEFSETDMAGIAHFASFVIYMEQAEHEFFRSLGLKIMNVQPDGAKISWPRVDCACSFDAPARYDDVLDVRVCVSKIGERSVTYEFEFYLDEKRIAHGTITAVHCRIGPDHKLQSIDIPAEIREKLAEYLKNG